MLRSPQEIIYSMNAENCWVQINFNQNLQILKVNHCFIVFVDVTQGQPHRMFARKPDRDFSLPSTPPGAAGGQWFGPTPCK
jgi:hypothetical protein